MKRDGAAPHTETPNLRRSNGNTRQRRHAATPTRAGGEKMWDRTTGFSLFRRGSPLWTGPDLNGGVKTGRRKPIWSHLTPTGAPFSLDPKNRFSFSGTEAKWVLNVFLSPDVPSSGGYAATFPL